MCQETRKCVKCGKEYPLTEAFFTKNQSTNTGGDKYFRTDCKECNNKMKLGRDTAYKNAGKPNYPDYGYNILTKKTENGYPCDNCGRTHYSKRIVFDHDHETLTHRGWLCDGCNRAMGMLGDDESGLINSLGYIYGIKLENRDGFIKMLKDSIKLYNETNGNTIITG